MSIALAALVVLASTYAIALGFVGKRGQEVELRYKHPLGLRSAIVTESEKNWKIAHFSVHAVYYAQAMVNIVVALGLLSSLAFKEDIALTTYIGVSIWLGLNSIFVGARYYLSAKSIAEYF